MLYILTIRKSTGVTQQLYLHLHVCAASEICGLHDKHNTNRMLHSVLLIGKTIDIGCYDFINLPPTVYYEAMFYMYLPFQFLLMGTFVHFACASYNYMPSIEG